jgi:hypothetical protein
MPTLHADDAGFGIVDPGGHMYPASHGRQSLVPPVEYLPATHTVPEAAVDATPHDQPAMAVQLEHDAAPVAVYRPTPHASAVALAEAAVGHASPALQLLHDTAPETLKRPAGHIADGGLALVDAGGHAYPASQGLHTDAPPALNKPAPHIDTVPLVAPAVGHT